MKIINTQKELEELMENNNIFINDDLEIRCDICINANIKAQNINAKNIKAWDINARNIKVRNINARDINSRNINARDINSRNINAEDINAEDIKAGDIKAGDINSWDIKAENISYYAICFAYKSIACKSIIGRRSNSKHFVLDGTITENIK